MKKRDIAIIATATTLLSLITATVVWFIMEKPFEIGGIADDLLNPEEYEDYFDDEE